MKKENINKNYLRNIILKISFLDIEIENFKNNIDSFIKQIKINYPTVLSLNQSKDKIIKEDNDIKGINPKIIFRNKNEKQITLSVNELIIEYNGKLYKSFEETIINDLKIILQSLSLFNLRSVSSVSLRYISQTHEKENILKKQYIYPFNEENIIRSINRIEYLEKDINIIFNYGEYNENYPSKYIKSNFILDYEAKLNTPQNFNQILLIINELHDKIDKYFNKTVTSEFKNSLGE